MKNRKLGNLFACNVLRSTILIDCIFQIISTLQYICRNYRRNCRNSLAEIFVCDFALH